jgi:hypothetical protein
VWIAFCISGRFIAVENDSVPVVVGGEGGGGVPWWAFSREMKALRRTLAFALGDPADP